MAAQVVDSRICDLLCPRLQWPSLRSMRSRAQVEAEEVPDVTEKLGVTVVPYFAILKVRALRGCLVP